MARKSGFQKGENGGAKGGARPGCGRPSDWLRLKCQSIIEKKNLIEFLGKVANGENLQAQIKDRLHAVEILLDRGFGKPDQFLEVNQNAPPTFGILSAGVIGQILEAIEKRGN